MVTDPAVYRVLIADDEAPARRELKRLLGIDPTLQVIAEAENGEEAFTQAISLRPDIIFLDIQMPGMTGIETAKGFLRHSFFPLIIFVTAYDEFALRAFEVHAVDYILKPVRQDRFESLLQRLHTLLDGNSNPQEYVQRVISSFQPPKEPDTRISVYKGEAIIPIRTDRIIYVEAAGRHCDIMTDSGLYHSGYLLYELEQLLSGPRFFCCHRSYIVNLDHIQSVQLWVNSSYRLKMEGSDTLIPVSRSRTTELKRLLNLQ